MSAVFQLRATLRGVEPAVWRRLRVPEDSSLAELHEVLQAAMGWLDRQDHEFVHAGRRFGPAAPGRRREVEDEWAVTLGELVRAPGDRLVYRYDLEARWEHDLLLEGSDDGSGWAGLPRCLDGAGACPPEGCGGPDGYRELRSALGDATHPGHGPAVLRAGERFSPEGVSIAEANARIEGLFADCWVGGILPLPAEIGDDLPVPHSLVVWLDERYGTIVGRDLVPSTESAEAAVASVLRVLGESVDATGRAPVRLRVAEPDLARRLRFRLGDEVEVVEGPTPELAELRETIAEKAAARNGTTAEPTSYLDDGRIEPERMARFFAAAARLYRARPWEGFGRGDLLVLESKSLALDGAVVLVAGERGDDFGFLLFESAEDCATFLESPAESGLDPCRRSPTVPTRLVHFERGALVPAPMRREIGRHLWEVAEARAYPMLALLDGEGAARHIDGRELARITACAEVVARLVERHGEALRSRPVTEVMVVSDLPGRARVRVRVGLRAGSPRGSGPRGRSTRGRR